jgi:hypothetical protein
MLVPWDYDCGRRYGVIEDKKYRPKASQSLGPGRVDRRLMRENSGRIGFAAASLIPAKCRPDGAAHTPNRKDG